MVAVAASPTPGAAAGSPFSTRSHDHPPYKDMILRALEALNGRKGSSRHAISKYISGNYSDLPPTHSSLLSLNLRRLQSQGVIRMFKHSYKLADAPGAEDGGVAVGSKKRGRPRKIVPASSSVLDETPKKRGRLPKLGAGSPPAKKIKLDRLPTRKTPAVIDPAAVYILPQAEQLKSGFLQSLPGAVAIVLPVGLLSKKTAKSPVLILPNGVQSLVDASVGTKKLGRPKKIEVKKKPEPPKVVEKRPSGLPRRKSMLPKQVLLHNGGANFSDANIGAKKLGRPRKIRDSVPHENGQLKSFDLAGNETEQKILKNSSIPGSFQVVQNISSLELKKRPIKRPKKYTVVEGVENEGNWLSSDVLVNVMRPGEGPCVAVVKEVLMDGSCKLALGSTGDGDIITAHPADVEAVRPIRFDKIKIMNGALRGFTGKLIGIDDADGIVKMDDTYEVKILEMSILAKLAI